MFSVEEEEEEEPLLIYTAQGSPFTRKKLSVINGSPEQKAVVKAKHEKLFPPLSATHVLVRDRTHLNKIILFAHSTKLCISGLIDDLSNIYEYFFFVSSAGTIYNVPF